MSTRTATSCFLAIAIAISVHEASAQPAPSLPPPLAADPVSPAEPPQAKVAELGPTRLFLAPTARTPPRGKGTFGLTEIAFPWGEIGLTDRAGLRVFAIPPLGDLTSAGVVIEPKIQLYGGARLQAAVGVVQAFAGQGESGGTGYGVVTLGSAHAAVTVGYGYGYGGMVDSEGSRGVLFLGAEKALGRHLRLIGEAYVGGAAFGLPDQTIFGGFRFSSGRFSADFAVVVPFYETGSGMPGPLLTIGWAF
jgi:hypothetical protein